MGLTKPDESILDLTNTDQDIADNVSDIATNAADIAAIETDINYLATRQCILSATTDSNGYNNMLSISSGQVILDATTEDCILTWANGYSEKGEVNYIKRLTSNQSPAEWDLSGEADDDYYLYIENDGAGNLTYGHSTVKPQYGYAKGSAGTSGLDYFVIPEMKLYNDNGSLWTQKYRVYVGEVNKASSVYTIKNYAIKGQYFVDWSSVPAVGGVHSYNHSIGVNENLINIDGNVKLAVTGRIVRFYHLFNGANNSYAIEVFQLSTTNIQIKRDGSASLWYATSGTTDNNAPSQYTFTVKRGF